MVAVVSSEGWQPFEPAGATGHPTTGDSQGYERLPCNAHIGSHLRSECAVRVTRWPGGSELAGKSSVVNLENATVVELFGRVVVVAAILRPILCWFRVANALLKRVQSGAKFVSVLFDLCIVGLCRGD